MKLNDLLKNVDVLERVNFSDNIVIDNVCDNSNSCTKNSVLVCINGYNTKGEKYVRQAIEKGACAVVCENKLDANITQIIVKDCRKALSLISQNFYNNAHKKLKIIGIVGTNGKTSCCNIIYNMLLNLNKKVGMIGTNMVKFNDKEYEINLTTPDPLQLNEWFLKMVNENVEYVVMEVSAHAIYLNKVYGIKFESLLYTNISQDHLDFFKTMENYSNVKIDFFNTQNAKSCVVNIDDSYATNLLNKTELPVLTYGIKNPSDIFAINLKMDLTGSNFTVNICDEIDNVSTNLKGLFNIYNILGSMGVLKMLGFKSEEIFNSIKNLDVVKGRFNLIKQGQNFNVVIDYAHTPESLEKILNEIKVLTKNEIICVFGCPGNRDETKRSIMGEIAGKYCSFVVITNDNCQYENSFLIMKEIEKGVKKTNCQYLMVEDRKLAIKCAMSVIKPNQTLLIAGKGMETYQNINGFKVPYSDFKVATSCLNEIKNKSKVI